MTKSIGILVSILAGVIFELIFFYILSAFEDETHLIAGLSCGLAGIVVFVGVINYLSKNKTRTKDSHQGRQQLNYFIYAIFLGLSIATTSLALWAKEKKEFQQRREYREQIRNESHDKTIPDDYRKGNKQYPTGRQQMINDGWEEVCYATTYILRNGECELGDYYYIFYKDGRYSAIKSESANSIAAASRFSVTLGDYYVGGKSFNARISVYSTLTYFNL